MAKQRKIVDYSRFHEVFINMNPSQQWFDEWGEDVIACHGSIKYFPYFRKNRDNIDFIEQVKSLQTTLMAIKNNIEITVKNNPGIKDPNYRERLKKCNEYLNAEIITYEKLEQLNFITTHIKNMSYEDIKQYEEDCKKVRNSIISAFIAIELNKDKAFTVFSYSSSIWIQLLCLSVFSYISLFLYLLITDPQGFQEAFSGPPESSPILWIPFYLIAVAVVLNIILLAFVVPIMIFVWMKVHEKDMKFIHTKLLLFDEPNPDDSFKKNSKEVLKTGLKIGILSKILFRK